MRFVAWQDRAGVRNGSSDTEKPQSLESALSFMRQDIWAVIEKDDGTFWLLIEPRSWKGESTFEAMRAAGRARTYKTEDAAIAAARML